MRLIGMVSLTLLCFQARAASPWPSETWQDSEVLTHLDGDFVVNLSGAYWNDATRTLWVCVNSPGKFLALVEDGAGSFEVAYQSGLRGEWSPGGDLEGITQVDPTEQAVYVINEGTDLITKYDVSTFGSPILAQQWNIKSYVPTSGGSGSEGITFVPDEWLTRSGFTDPEGQPYVSKNGMGGLMFVAHQNGGGIYVFDLDPLDGSYSFVGSYLTSRTESSGLEFDRSNGLLYIWHNVDGNKLEITDLTSFERSDGKQQFTTLLEYDGPKGGNLEGFAMTNAGSGDDWAFLTDDDNQDGAALMWFESFLPDLLSDDSYSLFANTVLTVSTPGVAANDIGLPGDAILITEPAHGLLTDLFAGDPFDGSFEYTPDEGYTGTDSFTYASDNGSASPETTTVSLTVDPVSSSVTRVTSGSDDAEESSSGVVSTSSSDLELVRDATHQTVGIRFRSVNVPAGSVITRAYIQFAVDETGNESTDLLVEGEDSANAPAFKTATGNISARPPTASAVAWSPDAWSIVNQAGPYQRTPDLSGIVQELVDGAGWESGNAMVFLVTGVGKRVARAYEANASLAPLLHIEFEPVGSAPVTTVVSQLASSADDAEESATGAVNLTSTDLELVTDSTAQKVGMRFRSVAVPTGATITRAYIQFAVDETSTSATNLQIRGQAHGNPDAFSPTSGNISSRSLTAASVGWTPASWGLVGDSGSGQRSPDIRSVVQELVDRADWQPGNAMVFVVSGTGKRTAESYDGSRALAPMLVVEYQ